MADRALIVAIWNYVAVEGLAPVALDSVKPSAEKFYDWLRNTRKIAPENIFICSDGLTFPADQPLTREVNNKEMKLSFGTTFTEIGAAIANLITIAPNQTGDLFVYCAGHGFSYRGNPNDQGVSFLLTSEFSNPTTGGNACINLYQLQRKFAAIISGGARHFHFVDACRNELSASSIYPQGQIAFPTPAMGDRDAGLYALYSAMYGDVAKADSQFNDILMAGLKGDGSAKEWRDGELWVTFNHLVRYANRALGRPVDFSAGKDSEDQIYLVPKPWEQACIIRVNNPVSADAYQLNVQFGGIPLATRTIDDLPYTLPLQPTDNPYQLSLQQNGQDLRMVSPSERIYMYSECEVVFEPIVPGGPPVAASPRTETAKLTINPDFFNTPPGSRVPDRSFTVDGAPLAEPAPELDGPAGDVKAELYPGEHQVSLIEDGQPVWNTMVNLSAGESTKLLVGTKAPTPFQQDMLKTIGQETYLTPDLSETLGPTADWDANLWLAYLGTAHLRPVEGKYLKLQSVLAQFDTSPKLTEGEAGLMVMAVNEQGNPEAAVHSGSEVVWSALRPVGEFSSLYYKVTTVQPGPALVSLRGTNTEIDPFTYATTFEAGIYTLITVSMGTRIRMQQFAIRPSQDMHDDWAHPDLGDLRTARALSYAQAAYGKRKPVWQGPFAPKEVWKDVAAGKWKNSQLATLCAFDAKRRGLKDALGEILSAYTLVDSNGFASDLNYLRHGVDARSLRPPLLLDAYLSAPDEEKKAELSAGHIDFRGLWVSWYGAVAEATAGASTPLPQLAPTLAAEVPVKEEVNEATQERAMEQS